MSNKLLPPSGDIVKDLIFLYGIIMAATTSEWDDLHITHISIDLIFLQSNGKAGCALPDTTGEKTKILRVIYCSRHLAVYQDGLVAQQQPTLTKYIMTHYDILMNLMQDRNGYRDNYFLN